MESRLFTRETLVVVLVLLASFAVSELLPIGSLPGLLLVVFVVLVGVFVIVPGARATLYRTTGIAGWAWLLGASVAGAGVTLSYLVGDPQPFCEGFTARGCLTPFGWATTIFVGSSFGVAIGAGHLGRYRRMRQASAVPAADVAEGVVSVEGRIVPAGGTVTGPVSGEAAVWYRTATERPTLFTAHREVDRDTAGAEFYVEDGSGRLLVLADRIDEHLAAEFGHERTADENDGRRREWSFRPDDPVTVVGRASDVSRAKYPEPFVLGLDGPVIVGEQTLADLRVWAARRAVLGTALAVVFGGASLVVMLLTA